MLIYLPSLIHASLSEVPCVPLLVNRVKDRTFFY